MREDKFILKEIASPVSSKDYRQGNGRGTGVEIRICRSEFRMHTLEALEVLHLQKMAFMKIQVECGFSHMEEKNV